MSQNPTPLRKTQHTNTSKSRLCSGHSCETQLITTTNDIMKTFDKKEQTDLAILDFSKAFDTVTNRKLLH